MRTSRDAVAVADAEVWDGETDAGSDGESDAGSDGEPDAGSDGEGEADPDSDSVGFAVCVCGGSAVGLAVEAEVVGEGLGDGEGDGSFGGLGVGVGEAVLETGSTWHFASWPGEAVGLGVAAGLSEPACAVPAQAASAPRISKPPASKLSVIALACTKRTDIALS
jgi:hypothetical protein